MLTNYAHQFQNLCCLCCPELKPSKGVKTLLSSCANGICPSVSDRPPFCPNRCFLSSLTQSGPSPEATVAPPPEGTKAPQSWGGSTFTSLLIVAATNISSDVCFRVTSLCSSRCWGASNVIQLAHFHLPIWELLC